MEFMEKLQKARDLAGIPFNIISGCRCPMKNRRVGGAFSSDHISTGMLQCSGADIGCYSSQNRYIIINAALSSGINRIGIGETFLHLSISDINPQNVVWLY